MTDEPDTAAADEERTEGVARWWFQDGCWIYVLFDGSTYHSKLGSLGPHFEVKRSKLIKGRPS